MAPLAQALNCRERAVELRFHPISVIIREIRNLPLRTALGPMRGAQAQVCLSIMPVTRSRRIRCQTRDR